MFFSKSSFDFKNEYHTETKQSNKPRLLIENLKGNFIKDGNIILDINGLHLFDSIDKNGKFYFGEFCLNVKIINFNTQENDILINDFEINYDFDCKSKTKIPQHYFVIIFDKSIFIQYLQFKNLVNRYFKLQILTDKFVLYRKINSNHKLTKISYILLGYYLIELQVTIEEPFFTRRSNRNEFNKKKRSVKNNFLNLLVRD